MLGTSGALGTGLCIPAKELTLGQLLAEGGEGRVFELDSIPGPLANWPLGTGEGLVYKQLRQPREAQDLANTVSFLMALAARDPALAARVRAASAWPVALAVGETPAVAVGSLMPRAPGWFWLRHREGGPRLATLSYLASDPDRIAFAYGTKVPAPGTPSRVGVVYALARLLEAWQGTAARSEATAGPEVWDGTGRAVHGDLSARNVLWSLDPVPAVYVLDCDGAAVTAGSLVPGSGPQGQPVGRPVRATTPNWDDPGLAPGAGPGLWSDRYLLGLAFLRVVGAAHFPVQARQRRGEKLNIDLEVPHSWRHLPDMVQLWGLCERALSLVDMPSRPTPGEWAAALEELLHNMGSAELAARVRAAQGDPRPSLAGAALKEERERSSPVPLTVPDVEVRPVVRRRRVSAWQLVGSSAAEPGPLATGSNIAGLGPGQLGTGAARQLSGASALTGGGSGLVGLGVGNIGPRQFLRRCGEAWGAAHRLALGLLASRGRRIDGLRRFVLVLVVDLVAACVVLFLVGEIVSPWIGL